jgi:hypothetical protein
MPQAPRIGRDETERSSPAMTLNDDTPNTREKIQDVLNALRSGEVFLGENAENKRDEMIKWCENWIEIYDHLPQNPPKQSN